jgi:hypothetical protein
MRRIIRCILCGFSCAMLLGTCVVWVRSYWVIDVFSASSAVNREWTDDGLAYSRTVWAIDTGRGGIRFGEYKTLGSTAPLPAAPKLQHLRGNRWGQPVRYPASYFMPLKIPNALGFGLDRLVGPRGELRSVTIPCYFLATISSALPLRSALQWVRRRCRERTGCCLACGYDLRASRNTCPECGASCSH